MKSVLCQQFRRDESRTLVDLKEECFFVCVTISETAWLLMKSVSCQQFQRDESQTLVDLKDECFFVCVPPISDTVWLLTAGKECFVSVISER